MGKCVLSHLKDKLAWAIDKQLQGITIISDKMLFKTVIQLKKYRIKPI